MSQNTITLPPVEAVDDARRRTCRGRSPGPPAPASPGSPRRPSCRTRGPRSRGSRSGRSSRRCWRRPGRATAGSTTSCRRRARSPAGPARRPGCVGMNGAWSLVTWGQPRSGSARWSAPIGPVGSGLGRAYGGLLDQRGVGRLGLRRSAALLRRGLLRRRSCCVVDFLRRTSWPPTSSSASWRSSWPGASTGPGLPLAQQLDRLLEVELARGRRPAGTAGVGGAVGDVRARTGRRARGPAHPTRGAAPRSASGGFGVPRPRPASAGRRSPRPPRA